MNKKAGFTLLELIIVIIIVGVLAATALPRFFRTVEFSRSTEALVSMSAVRQALERCYLMNNGTYATCTTFANIGLDDPGASPNSHFSYAMGSLSATGYAIAATRNTRDGGSVTSTITLTQTTTGITRSGTGAFLGIQ